MEIHLKIIGWLLMSLAAVHVIFPRYFNWKEELSRLSLINRQMMMVHTFFIAFGVFLMGLLCATSATELTQTELGKRIAFGLGLFWTIRFFIQLFGYSAQLWRGKAFETAVHIVFSMVWAYMSGVFWVVYAG